MTILDCGCEASETLPMCGCCNRCLEHCVCEDRVNPIILEALGQIIGDLKLTKVVRVCRDGPE